MLFNNPRFRQRTPQDMPECQDGPGVWRPVPLMAIMEIDRLTRALREIAELPISAQDDMLSANMRQIAINALSQ